MSPLYCVDDRAKIMAQLSYEQVSLRHYPMLENLF